MPSSYATTPVAANRTLDLALTRNPEMLTVPAASPIAGDTSHIGRGFSSLGQEWKGDGVAFTGGSERPNASAVETVLDLELIENADEFCSFMGLSAAASMSYGIFQAEGSVKQIRTIERNSTHIFLAGKVTVHSQPAQINATGLTDLAQQAMRQGPVAFHRAFGNFFATSTIYGGEFIFLLEISTRDERQKSSFRADLKAKLGNFGGASAQFDESMNYIASRYQLKASLIRNGLNEDLPDLTAPSLRQYAASFPHRLTENNGAAMVPIRYGFRRYTSVEPSAPSYVDAELFLDKVVREFVQTRLFLSEVEAWRQDPTAFRHVDPATASLILKDGEAAAGYLDRLVQCATRCADNPMANLVLPRAPHIVSRSELRRLEWFRFPVDTNQWIEVTTVPATENKPLRLRFRGLWSPSGGTTWWETTDSWSIRVTGSDGREKRFPDRGSITVLAGDKLEARLGDNILQDNREHPTDPASVAMDWR